MCNFISWKEIDDQILFLTSNDIYNTKRGQELQKHTNEVDFVGHGAIAFFYEIDPNKGTNRECRDFSSPSNFPPVIAEAIKAGKMSLGVSEQLLTPEAWGEYEKITKPALAEYDKTRLAAWAEYEKIRNAALAKYYKIVKPALAKYEKIRDAARAEYEKICNAALAKYEKTYLAAFWTLFSNPLNRPEIWR